MKKLFLLIFAFGLMSMQAQNVAKAFKPADYTKQLSEKIVTLLDINDGATVEKIQKETYMYAMSIQKHLILFDQKGLTNGKTLDEAIEMVKPHALKATKFDVQLEKLLGAEKMNKLRESGLF